MVPDNDAACQQPFSFSSNARGISACKARIRQAEPAVFRLAANDCALRRASSLNVLAGQATGVAVAGGKVCALASRFEARDYADTARMLERYSLAELIGFAGRFVRGLTADDFADAGMQLDRMDDEEFPATGSLGEKSLRCGSSSRPGHADLIRSPGKCVPADTGILEATWAPECCRHVRASQD